jgi:hypothetical protein
LVDGHERVPRARHSTRRGRRTIGPVHQLGIDETSYLAATREHPTIYATGLVDLQRHIVIDMVQENSVADLRRWTCSVDPEWLAVWR